MHEQFINSRLSCSICFFTTNSSQFFNFLAISCMIFLEESISQFQFYIQANFVSLSLICPSICLMQLKSLRFKFLIDLLKSKVRISLFPIFRLNPSLSFIQFFAEPLSLLRRRSQLSVQGFFWRFSLSFKKSTTFVSRSLFPFRQ